MLALIVAVLGTVGVWLLAALLLLLAWFVDRYPWGFWVVLISLFGGITGIGIYHDFIAAG